MSSPQSPSLFFFFNDTATPEIYTLSLHDALPILSRCPKWSWKASRPIFLCTAKRSEEHTSELQSRFDLVCRLLLEKKNIYKLLFIFLINITYQINYQRHILQR